MRSVRRKPLVATLMATFLAAHLSCVCAGPALATTMALGNAALARTTAADPHACCHQKSSTPAHHQSRTCQHCHRAQLTTSESPRLPAPSFGPSLGGLPVATLTPPRAWGNQQHTGHAADGHAPPGPGLRPCVLLL